MTKEQIGVTDVTSPSALSARTVNTFVMAHLLTACADLAEKSTLEAINAWNPEIEGEDELLRHGVTAALKKRRTRTPHGVGDAAAYLPNELQAVLDLKPPLRRSFSLRVLAGFPASICAELLGLPLSRVEQHVCAAVAQLSPVHQKRSKGRPLPLRPSNKTVDAARKGELICPNC